MRCYTFLSKLALTLQGDRRNVTAGEPDETPDQFSIGGIIPTLLTACRTVGQSSYAPNLVTTNANLIAQIQVSRIREDVDFQALYQQTPENSDDPQNFDELLTKAQEETGIDFSKFSTATVFADVTGDAE